MAALSTERPEVHVIGAGFAGLAAATMLVEAGVTVQVFEARPGLGGRATAFRDPITGERIDNGQHVLAGCYTETLAFLRRIGSASRLHRPSGLSITMIDERGHESRLTLPPLAAPFHLLAGILAWDGLPLGDRLSVLGAARSLRRVHQAPRTSDGEATVRQWLEQHRQSPRLCQMFWEPLALAALNQSVDEASAEMFLAVIARMFGPDPAAASLLLPAVPLDDLYAHPAAHFIQAAGSTIQTHSTARLRCRDDRVLGVAIGDDEYQASCVISAVPWFAVAGLFDETPAALVTIVRESAALASSPIVTVNLWFDRQLVPQAFVGLPGRTFQWVFNRSQLLGDSQTHLSLVSSGAETLSELANANLIALARSDLESAIPAASRAVLRHALVVRERRATFSLRPGGPVRPGTRTPIEGLFLAGDWIDTGLPATIESAVASGHAAARAVLEGRRGRSGRSGG